MNDRFDVFDSLGNKVGEFTPTDGSGDLVGLVVILALILVPAAVVVALSVLLLPLIPVGYVYGLIVLAEQGFKAARKGDWGEAIVCWVFILIPAIFVYWLASIGVI